MNPRCLSASLVFKTSAINLSAIAPDKGGTVAVPASILKSPLSRGSFGATLCKTITLFHRAGPQIYRSFTDISTNHAMCYYAKSSAKPGLPQAQDKSGSLITCASKRVRFVSRPVSYVPLFPRPDLYRNGQSPSACVFEAFSLQVAHAWRYSSAFSIHQ